MPIPFFSEIWYNICVNERGKRAVKTEPNKLNIGELLVYGARGVCRVTDVKTESFGGAEKEYYLLSPKDDPNATIYLATDSDRIEKNVRRIATADEIYEIVKALPKGGGEWIENNKRRAEYFSKTLSEGSRGEIVGIIRAIRKQRCELEKKGKRLNVSDKNVLERAEKIVNDEFSLVLNIRPDEVAQFIIKNSEPA